MKTTPTENQVSQMRHSQFAGSAATLVALLSMVSIGATIPSGGSMPTESRPVASDAQSMRAIAVAVVAAAARDMLGADWLDASVQCSTSMAMAEGGTELAFAVAQVCMPCVSMILPERLIDLPPPAC